MSAVITSIGFCPTKSVTGRQNRRDHVGHACFIYSFEPVIAASKQLPYEVCPEAGTLFYVLSELSYTGALPMGMPPNMGACSGPSKPGPLVQKAMVISISVRRWLPDFLGAVSFTGKG